MRGKTQVRDLLDALETIAPLRLSADWDNTGMLVEIPDQRVVHHAFLTIDFTEAVLEEALAESCDFVIAYHPPIFVGQKRLLASKTSQRVLLRAIRAGISIYSPHTALDAADGGVNDWLCSAFCQDTGTFAGSTATPIPDPLPAQESAALGRRITLNEPTPLEAVIEQIKQHLGLDHVRVATHHDTSHTITSIALCAGAGGSVVLGQDADLYWTGEMRHHDVLAALEHGRSVVLCEHTNTERGYLPVLRDKLRSALPMLKTTVAAADAEPLRVV